MNQSKESDVIKEKNVVCKYVQYCYQMMTFCFLVDFEWKKCSKLLIMHLNEVVLIFNQPSQSFVVTEKHGEHYVILSFQQNLFGS